MVTALKLVHQALIKILDNKLLFLDDDDDDGWEIDDFAKAEKELAKQGFKTINNFSEGWDQQDFILCIKES